MTSLSFKLSTLQKNTALILCFLGVLKIAGFFRDLVILNFFGVNRAVDIYFYSLLIPTVFSNILTSSFNLYFIPHYLQIKKNISQTAATHYFSRIFFILALTLIAVAVLYGGIAPSWLIANNPAIFAPGPDAELFYKLSLGASFFVIFSTLTALLNNLFQAEHYYGFSFLSNLLISLFTVIFIIIFHATLGVYAITAGMVCGAISGFLLIYWQSQKKNLVNSRFHTSAPANIDFKFHTFGFLLISQALHNLMLFLDRQMAVSLGAGKLTTLNYGMIIPDGLVEIFAQGLGIAVLSYFSEWKAKNDIKSIIEVSRRVIRACICIVLPGCFLLFYFAHPLVKIAFFRGALNSTDLQLITSVFQSYIFIVPPAIILIITARIVTAIGKNHFFAFLSAILLASKIVLNLFLVQILNIYGIPIATIFMYIIGCIIIILYLNKHGAYIFAPQN